MRKKSHISLAGQIINGLDLAGTLDHKFSFYFGSILPDCRPSFITTPHNFQRTFDGVKERVEKMIEEYNQDGTLNRRYCLRLGEVIHYIADYFTFPHNSNYDGNLKDHCVYEEELKHELKRYIRSGEAMVHLKDLTVYETPQELFSFIQNMHHQYMEKKSIVTMDCKYIVHVCMEVIASIIAILKSTFTQVKPVVAPSL